MILFDTNSSLAEMSAIYIAFDLEDNSVIVVRGKITKESCTKLELVTFHTQSKTASYTDTVFLLAELYPFYAFRTLSSPWSFYLC